MKLAYTEVLALALVACAPAAASDEGDDQDVGALETASSAATPLDSAALAALDPSSCQAAPLDAEQLAKLFAEGVTKVEVRGRWISAARSNNGVSQGDWHAEKYSFAQNASTTDDPILVTAALRKGSPPQPIYLDIASGAPKTQVFESGSMWMMGSGGIVIADCPQGADGAGTCDSQYAWRLGRGERSAFAMKTQVNVEKGCIRMEHSETKSGTERRVVALASLR